MRLAAAVAPLLLIAASYASAQDAAERGARLHDDGKYADAAGVLVPAASASSKDARLAFLAGRSLLEWGAALRRDGRQDDADKRTGEGVKWLEKAVKLAPDDGAGHFWLGVGYGRQAMRANKLRQALLAPKVKAEFETAVRLDSSHVDARQGLIDYYLQAPGFMGGSVDKAKEQAAAMVRYDRLRGLYALASIDLRNRDTSAAVTRYAEASASFPDSIPPATLYAAVLGNTGRHDEAWAQVDRLVERAPEDPRVVFAVGRQAAVSGEQLERGAVALRAFLGGPGTPSLPPAAAHYRLGMILSRQGDNAAARRQYEAVLRLNPQHRDAKAALDTLR